MKFIRTISAIQTVLICFASFSFTSASGRSKSVKSRRETSYEDDNLDQYENEEYRQKKVIYQKGYPVVYMGNNIHKHSTSVMLNADIKRQMRKEKERERKRRLKESNSKSVFFNNTVESVSDISSVPDEAPKIHPSLTEFNPRFSDFTSNRRVRLLHHLGVRMGDFTMPPAQDYGDVLAANVRESNMYTSHQLEIDGYMSLSLKEQNMHLWRNPSIHPELIYNRNNEVDPLVATYSVDVDTSQKEFESHFGREIGRDKKTKLNENRNTFSSLNDGCVIC